MSTKPHPELAPPRPRADEAMGQVARDLRRLLVAAGIVVFVAGVATGLTLRRVVPLLETTTANTATLRQEVITLHRDVAAMRREVGTVRQEVQVTRRDVQAVTPRVVAIEGHTRELADTVVGFKRAIQGLLGQRR